jgi:hypothetical protein
LYRSVPFLLGLLSLAGPPAAAADCETGELGALVRQGKDLYLGEMHGTAEIPALVRCLVESALSNNPDELIVSLEQQPAARNAAGDAWRGTDGRGSEAMWELTQFLIREEKAGRLELHQHVPAVLPLKGNPPELDSAAYEKLMGEPLRGLAARGQLIALSGNAHSRNQAVPGLGYEPAGKYAGPDVLHIAVMAARGGTSWNCVGNKCGARTLPISGMPGARGTLTDGAWFGHDLIFWLDKSTSSPPKLPAVAGPPASS